MGFVKANITILNGVDLGLSKAGKLAEGEIRQVFVEALVDSGAFTLCINKEVQEALDLPILYSKPCRAAAGKYGFYDVAGPVEIRFDNRYTICEAVVSPDLHTVLLGVIPLEGMDVIINPNTERLEINPEHPEAGGAMTLCGLTI